MTRLIDADDTSKVFLKIMNLPEDYCGPSDIMISIDAVFSVLGQVPDADPVPVKHGRWLDTGRADYYLNKEYRCSCCNSVDYLCSPYCYNCGAKMDSEHKEE